MTEWVGLCQLMAGRLVRILSVFLLFLETHFISPFFENQQPKFYMKLRAMNSTDFEI